VNTNKDIRMTDECKRGLFGALLASVGILAILQPTTAGAAAPADWPMFGLNTQNTASDGRLLGDPSNLKVKWTFTTGGDVSARAAVVNGVVYFPDWGPPGSGSNLWAVNANTGKLVWGHQLSDYGLPAATHSRTSPAVVGGILYLGTQEGAYLLAINATTGNLIWKTQLESPANDPLAIVTASATVYGGAVYTGVASLQEGAAASPQFPCCSARGSVVKIDAVTGAIIWKSYTVPATGYTGGGAWGSNFVVDPARRSVFLGTGNNYKQSTDPAYLACISGGGTPASCSSADNHVDSMLALDMDTGAIKWSTRAVTWNQAGVANGSDNWNVACLVGFPAGTGNCPSDEGPDYDFASAPNLITFQNSNGTPKTILGAGQKSGIYYAFDPDTGAVLWRTQVGPGSALGGMEWGSASDGKRIYVSIANLYGIPYAAGSAGSWAALDPGTGAILWQVADPNGAIDIGPLAVAGGVVFASSMAGALTAPTMLGLNANNGKIVWSFAPGSSVNAGAAIYNGVVYWGSGYTHLGIPGFTGNNKFYAFSNNGK